MILPLEHLMEGCSGRQWRTIGIKPHHGINVPVFSLRSRKSCGIGEYTDLLPLIDWCATIGFSCIQLLPLNDGGPESSPYSALSAFALNPLNLGIAHLPSLELMSQEEYLLNELEKLNHLPRLSYQAIQAKREAFLRAYFKIVGPLLANLPEFAAFRKEHTWLENYALFKSLKIETQWQSWEEWPSDLRDPSQAGYQALLEKYQNEILYHSILQFLCFGQMESVKRHAESRNIFIKGDIPILINRESADVWRYRKFYDLNFAAGAPPDMYSFEGQKWGFPIYDWSTLEEEDYRPWRQRLRIAQHLYHLYRLDHVVGFFRIWAIPLDKNACEGHFQPANPSQWVPQGEKILRMMLSECLLLPIGEDLGLVPLEVRASLNSLGICGTKVMRWERNWDVDRRFIKIEDYNPLSMTTVSTHDSDTLQLWWRNTPAEAGDYARYKDWDYKPDLSVDYRKQILLDSHRSASIFHINLLQEYLALFPEMTWPDPEDERINVPGTVSDRNWSYRFRPFVEDIVSHAPLTDFMKTLVDGMDEVD